MDVYKIVITVIALAIVTILSVIAERLGKTQKTRRVSPSDRHKTQPDKHKDEAQKGETITSPASQVRVDGQQNRESPQPEVRKPTESSWEQDG